MKTPSVLAAASAALLIASFSPATAASRHGTWWGGVDGWLAEMTNANMDVALKDDPSFNSGGQVVSLDFSPEFSGRIRGGWQPRDPTHNAYSISYWSFDRNDYVAASGGVLPIITDPLFGNFDSASVQSAANIRASSLDLMLSRRLAGSRSSEWYWAVGVRRSEYKQEWGIDYFDPLVVPSGPREKVQIRVDSKGAGLTAGIGGSYKWMKRLRTAGRVQVSLLRGTTDLKSVDRGFNDDPFIFAFQTTGVERNGTDRVFQQLDLEARVIYRVWKTLDVSAGYMFMNMGQMAEVDRFLDDIQGAPAALRDDVSFNGFIFGASYLFE